MCVAYLNANSQEKIEEINLRNVKGVAIGNNNESIEQVTQRAINEAKVEALKKAGIEESISSYTDYFQSENNETFEEVFNTNILSDIRGAVKSVEILETKNTFDEFNKLNIEVLINCTVVKYNTKKDFSFDIWVDGIGMFYQNEENLIFKVKSTKNAYANMFIFNENEAYMVFPNDIEKSFLLKENVEYKFPTDKANYILTTKEKAENHRIIMIFTKDEISYTGEVNYKDIIDWIYAIPPDMRIIETFSFSVVNENKI